MNYVYINFPNQQSEYLNINRYFTIPYILFPNKYPIP